MTSENTKTLAQNKKARHDYFVTETIECGIELFGTEVKSIRLGKVNIADAYASLDNSEVYVKGMNISPYEQGNIFNRDPLRYKKLLLHKSQIRKLIGQVQQEGYALIPLSVYLKGSKVKLLLGVCKGKKLYDKRADLQKRDLKRNLDRAFKEHNSGSVRNFL
ncbi:MAG: SsrA-binding protein SmpB [Firmicutes bacterium]|nr:SsrA-binding protein SmpB [Bacillota bacterium]